MRNKGKISGFMPLAAFLLYALAFNTTALANPDDYNPVTGEPECIKCHTGERRYSIDYTRDETCVQCHGPGLSGDYIAINDRFRPASPRGAEEAAGGSSHAAPASTSAGRRDLVGDGPRGAKAEKREKRKAPGLRPGKLTLGETRSMVLVSAGEFTMGSNDWWPKSQPEHRRTLKAFYVDRYEVTNLRYREFVEKTGYHPPDHWINGVVPPGREEHPVVYVDWNDADAFCRWEGKRLPTEAEWEKAARGTDKRTFPWGDVFSKYKGNTPQLGKGDTMAVGSFEEGKSPYGAYDMAGNVFEWVSDWFKPYPGNNHPDENYGEKFKVVRGGSWYDCTYYKCGISSPAYNRIFFNTPTKNNNFGFRCVKDR